MTISFTTEFDKANVTTEDLAKRQLFFRGLGVETDRCENNENILERAGLNFTVDHSNVLYRNGLGNLKTSSTQMLSYIDPFYGTTKQLGTVSKDWAESMMQPSMVLETFKTFCRENDLDLQRVGKIERVTKKGDGELHSKLNLFMVADLSQRFSIQENDPIIAKLLITAPFEYGKGYTVNLLAKRLVCSNGMSTKVYGSSKIMGHTCTTQKRLTDALQNAIFSWQNQTETYSLLSKQQLPTEIGLAFLVANFSKSDQCKLLANNLVDLYSNKASDKQLQGSAAYLSEFLDLSKESKLLQTAYKLYHNQTYIGSDLKGSGTSLWGMMNAITEFYQHHDKFRNNDSNFLSLYVNGDRINNVNRFLNNAVSFARVLETV